MFFKIWINKNSTRVKITKYDKKFLKELLFLIKSARIIVKEAFTIPDILKIYPIYLGSNCNPLFNHNGK